MSSHADFIIVGAGIAGASVAAELAPHASVILLEQEDVPGYHSTGRSAAFWHESYGGPVVRPLTAASARMLGDPPGDFCETPLLKLRGAINIVHDDDQQAYDLWMAAFGKTDMHIVPLDRDALVALLPDLLAGWNRGISEPDCSDIDVAALHGAYLRQARRAGAQLVTRAELISARFANGSWQVETGAGSYVGATLINAAGGWADQVAERAGARPLGVQPYLRTMVQLRLAQPVSADMPLVLDISGSFYVKGEAQGRIWLSPHDEKPVLAGDVAPDELDIAIAIDRMEHAFGWTVQAVERSWAGLRSFAPDRLPLYGWASEQPGFYWCAGQGGFGIQTAPAAAKMVAADLLGIASDPLLSRVNPADYRPSRLD